MKKILQFADIIIANEYYFLGWIDMVAGLLPNETISSTT